MPDTIISNNKVVDSTTSVNKSNNQEKHTDKSTESITVSKCTHAEVCDNGICNVKTCNGDQCNTVQYRQFEDTKNTLGIRIVFYIVFLLMMMMYINFIPKANKNMLFALLSPFISFGLILQLEQTFQYNTVIPCLLSILLGMSLSKIKRM